MKRTKNKMTLGDIGFSLRQKYIQSMSENLDEQILKTKNIHILANDPSVCAWGYSVLDQNGNIVDQGCIKTVGGGKKMRIRKGDDTIRRIREINQRLITVIKKYNVEYLLSELPHGSQNASAAVTQGVVSGIMQTISDCMEIGIEWYSEGDSKKCLLGKTSAEKKETIDAISKLYGTKWKSGIKYIDEAIADSLSIHYVASKQSSALKLFKI
jgi:Holliday junction resolvasome RuvABC endonuclease subunit